MRATEHVHFVELAGPEAQDLLERQADRWRGAGVDTALLRSDDRDDLWLLVGRAPEPPPPATVAAAKQWRFHRPPQTNGPPADEPEAEAARANGSDTEARLLADTQPEPAGDEDEPA